MQHDPWNFPAGTKPILNAWDKALLQGTIRWMVRRDLSQVLSIESESWKEPWDEKEFIRHLRQRGVTSQIIEVDNAVLGYIVTQAVKPEQTIHILNISVELSYRRYGLGRCLIERLLQRVQRTKIKHIQAHLYESNITGAKFLAACGFRSRLLREYWEDKRDAYLMEYGVVN